MNRKGDVHRYIIWFVILLIIILLALALFYSSAISILKGLVYS